MHTMISGPRGSRGDNRSRYGPPNRGRGNFCGDRFDRGGGGDRGRGWHRGNRQRGPGGGFVAPDMCKLLSLFSGEIE